MVKSVPQTTYILIFKSLQFDFFVTRFSRQYFSTQPLRCAHLV